MATPVGMVGADQPRRSAGTYGDQPSSDRRRAIPATCELHRGAVGYTNLMVSKCDGLIVLDPHVTGSCVISLDENAATALLDTLTNWLG